MRKLLYSMMVGLLWILSACTPITSGSSASSAAAPAATTASTPVKLGVGYIPNVQFAIFYVGIDKGFYSAEGLNVSLDYGFENDYLKLVGIGQSQFMVGSGDQVVLGRAQGLPVRYVAKWYTKYPVVIFAKQSANITKPADLVGKKVGIPGPFGASYVALLGILDAAQLKESDIKLESIGFTQVAALSEDKIDAAVDYDVNGPVVMAQQGISTTQIALDQYLRIPANGLVTNDKTIQENPELVRKMVRATLNSIQYTLAHPDEAFAITLKFVPEAGGDNQKANRAVFDAVLKDWQPQGNETLGESQTEEWQAATDLMLRTKLIDKSVPTTALFTNEFLPK